MDPRMAKFFHVIFALLIVFYYIASAFATTETPISTEKNPSSNSSAQIGPENKGIKVEQGNINISDFRVPAPKRLPVPPQIPARTAPFRTCRLAAHLRLCRWVFCCKF